MEKVTKKDVLNAVKAVAENDSVDFGTVTAEDVINYVDVTIAQMDAKAAKAKEKAAQKKAEGDALRDTIESVLTDEYQSVNDIVNALDNEEITKAKVIARLTALIKAGKAHKVTAKTEDGRKIMVYAVGAAPVADAE